MSIQRQVSNIYFPLPQTYRDNIPPDPDTLCFGPHFYPPNVPSQRRYVVDRELLGRGPALIARGLWPILLYTLTEETSTSTLAGPVRYMTVLYTHSMASGALSLPHYVGKLDACKLPVLLPPSVASLNILLPFLVINLPCDLYLSTELFQ